MNTIEQKAITTIRFLAAEAVQKANSGHPGLPIGAAPMALASRATDRTGRSERRFMVMSV